MLPALPPGRYTIGDLLRLHAGIGGELKARGVSRTGNNPCADFAETLVSRTFGWPLNPNSRAGFDATAANGDRIEVKARRLGRAGASRQASAIRRIDTRPFDRLIGIVFAADYDVALAVDVPFDVVVARATHVAHTNSAKFFLRDDLRDAAGVVDVTAAVRATAHVLLSAHGA